MMERVALSAGRCGSECVEYSSINNIVILNNLALALAKIYGSISTNEMRVAKKEFKAFPVECISKVQLIMKDTEIIKQVKSNLRRKKR